MKRLSLVALIALVTLLGMVGFSQAGNEASTLQVSAKATNEAVSTLPIVCRGGGELYFNYMPSSNFSSDPQIWITFQKGSQKVGSNWENIGALMPGQCSWLDRPVSDNEPHRIIVKDLRDFSISWNQGRLSGISSELSYMKWLQDAYRYQSFYVYNDNQGNLILAGIDQAR
jgi:hypothetical protein